MACLRDPRAVIGAQRAAIEDAKAGQVAPTTRPDGTPSMEATRVQRVGIGANDATRRGAEMFDRDFRNRRELVAWAGRVAIPWASGTIAHDPGISKAGNPRVRKPLIQMAWRWVRSQPDNPITQGFDADCAAHNGRARKRAIVAVARKLLIAPRRFATPGLVPTGARRVA
ncbi:MAG: transposase [Rhodobacteraceae bacterium]|nr:transposase [Paracoccaceae bacterium]